MPTILEIRVVITFMLLLLLLVAISCVFLEQRISKLEKKIINEQKKRETEQHDIALINKAREVVFEDLCVYFESTKEKNHEVERKKE